MHAFACESVHLPAEAKWVLDPMELGLEAVVNYLTWVLGTNSGPLQIQQSLLTTEHSLQPTPLVFLCGTVRLHTLDTLGLSGTEIRSTPAILVSVLSCLC